jgi:hypothetical protein
MKTDSVKIVVQLQAFEVLSSTLEVLSRSNLHSTVKNHERIFNERARDDDAVAKC